MANLNQYIIFDLKNPQKIHIHENLFNCELNVYGV